MKLIKLPSLLILFAVLGSPSYGQIFGNQISMDKEGVGSGGGGGSFVCRDGDNIYSAVFQDIWEAKKDGIQLIATTPLDQTTEGDEWALSYKLIERLKVVSPKFYEQVLAALDVVKGIRLIDDVKFKPRGDSGHISEPFSCTQGETDYMPVAIYEGEKLTYSKKIWEKFVTLLERASTNIHEATYKVLRDEYGDISSDRTRKIVGKLAEENLNLTELRKWVPLSEFNPNSTKDYESKFKQLVDIFNKGEKFRDADLQRLDSYCFILNRANELLNPRSLDKIKIIFDLEGNLKFERDMSYDYLNPIMGKFKAAGKVTNHAPAFRDHEGGILYSSWWNSATSKAVPYYFSKDQYGNLVVALRYSPGNLKDPYLLMLYDECLEFGGFLNTSCIKYKEYNVLKQFPRVNPLAMMFCPRKK